MNRDHAAPTYREIALLRQLDRIITSHGLIEYRFTVELLADQLQNRALRVVGGSAALNCEIGALRKAVLQALKSRFRGTTRQPCNSPLDNRQIYEIEQIVRGSGLILEDARDQAAALARRLPELDVVVLDRVAVGLFQAYLDGSHWGGAEVQSIARQAIDVEVCAATAAIQHQVEQCRLQMAEALRSAREAMPEAPSFPRDPHPPQWQLPLLDSRSLTGRLHLRPVGRWRLLGQAVVRRRIYRQLEIRLRPQLTYLLRFYSTRMRKWVRQSFCSLQAAFSSVAQVHQARIMQLKPSYDSNSMALQAEDDILLLQRWAETTHSTYQ